MNNPDNNKWLDKELSKIIGSEKIIPDFEQWKKQNPHAVETLTTRTKDTNVSRSPLSIRNIIMKNPITKLAAAAVITVAVLMIFNNGSVNIASVTWADMQNAFLEQSWVHVEYDNGEEQWYNLIKGDYFAKQLYPSGYSYVYINRTENLRQRYTPERGQYISEDIPVIYKDNIIPPYKPQTAWEQIVGRLQRIAEQGSNENIDVEINYDTLDEKTVIRFDSYTIDALDQKLLTKRIWANPLTMLPIKIWKKLSLAEREEQNRTNIAGIFTFPEKGPLSIYDLGVPIALPLIKYDGNVVDTNIEKVIKIAKQYYEDFPKQCRAVIWENNRESEIEVIWRNDEKIRFNHYFNLREEQYPQYHLNLPATIDEVLTWIKTQQPVSIYIDDEKKSYHRNNPAAYEENKTPTTRITKSWRRGLPEQAHFIDNIWGYAIDRNISLYKIIDDAPETLSKYIGIRTETGDIRRDYYIDPAHDYIQVQYIWWKKRNNQWEKEREYIVTEMSQLPDGQWYISKRKLITYSDPEKDTQGFEYNYNIDIKLLNENEFPPDTFNGEKLIEGAKIETY